MSQDFTSTYAILNRDCTPVWNQDTNMHELVANQSLTIYPSMQAEIDTGFSVNLSTQECLWISAKESHAKYGLIMPIGCQMVRRSNDCIKIILRNTSAIPFKVQQGITKIAQFIVISSYRFPGL